jgi:hypothetical protein
MKIQHKVFLKLLFVFALSVNLFSQNGGEISFMYGYQMLGTVEVYGSKPGTIEPVTGKLDIDDGAYYGGVLGIKADQNVMFEVQYFYQPTQISFDEDGPVEEIVAGNIDVHYIMGGALYQKPFSKTAIGYGGLTAGAAGYVPSSDFETEWRFAVGLTLGVKFMLSKEIGLKLQAQGLFPIQWSSGSFYVGSDGTGFGLSSGSAITQVNVGGGLFYAF